MIYLDLNVFSELSRSRDPFASIKAKLNLDEIELCFSTAHILDLLSSTDTIMIAQDLLHIERLTASTYLHKPLNEHFIHKTNASPRLIYDSYPGKPQADISQSIENFAPEARDSLDQKMVEMLKTLTNSVDYDKIPEELRNMIPKPGETTFEFLSRAMKFQNEMMSAPKPYHSLRALVGDHMDFYRDCQDRSLRSLDKYLVKKVGHSFSDFVISTFGAQNIPLVNQTIWDYIPLLYTLLDMLGFAKDRIREGNTFYNISNDSQHSMFASVTDAFVTADRKCFDKTRIIYEFLGIGTQVFYYHDMASEI